MESWTCARCGIGVYRACYVKMSGATVIMSPTVIIDLFPLVWQENKLIRRLMNGTFLPQGHNNINSSALVHFSFRGSQWKIYNVTAGMVKQ